MKNFISIIFFVILISSCKKSSTDSSIPVGNPNHEVKAMVAVKGSSFSSFSAIGNSTVYAKRTDPNADIVITVLGGSNQGNIKITLVNINAAGTYTIGGGGFKAFKSVAIRAALGPCSAHP
jgi:hypothetical protein